MLRRPPPSAVVKPTGKQECLDAQLLGRIVASEARARVFVLVGQKLGDPRLFRFFQTSGSVLSLSRERDHDDDDDRGGAFCTHFQGQEVANDAFIKEYMEKAVALALASEPKQEDLVCEWSSDDRVQPQYRFGILLNFESG